jgi:carboxyl-terminal processing protease
MSDDRFYAPRTGVPPVRAGAPRPPRRRFPLLLLAAFAAGILVDRVTLYLTPGQQPPGLARTFAPFWEAWRLVHEYYVDQAGIDDTRLAQGAITGMLDSLGDVGHTTYMPREEWQHMKDTLEGHFYGIGATIGVRNRRPTILQTMPDSPARAAGLRAGDVVLSVDGKSVEGLSLDQIVQRVRGPAGTEVRLTILREGEPRPRELAIKRARVKVAEVSWHMLPGAPIAHVALREFGTNADPQLKEALAAARARGARGLILDVRGNPGGLKDQAVKVTGEFLPEGAVVFIEQDALGRQTKVPAPPGGGAAGDLPVVVLIDEGTASSAEIFAGALQDHHRAKLVGTRTFGTGTVLEPFPLSDGSAVLLAVDQWLTPDGRQIWHHGIRPDVEVALPPDANIVLPDGEDNLDATAFAKTQDKQLRKAFEVLRKELP